MRNLFIFLFSFNAFAIPTVSELTLFQIASNTLNTVREMNSLVNDTREFSENFERVHRKVDQTVWKADRTAMWIEDVHALNEQTIENPDDLVSILQRIKAESKQLKRTLIEEERKMKLLKEIETTTDEDEKRDKKQLIAAISSTSSESSTNAATIETAKNTKELVIAQHKQNLRLNKLNKSVAAIGKTVIKQRQEEVALKDEENKANKPFKEGIIQKKDLK